MKMDSKTLEYKRQMRINMKRFEDPAEWDRALVYLEKNKNEMENI